MQKVDKFGQQIYQTAANFMCFLCQENIIINSINNSSNIFIKVWRLWISTKKVGLKTFWKINLVSVSKVSINSIRTSEVKSDLSVGLCG